VLLNYLRTGELVWPTDEAHKRELELELEFYQFEHHKPPQQFPDSTILAPSQQEHLIAWRQKLRGGLSSVQEGTGWRLLYRMSRDGTRIDDFTQRCTNKGETFLVAKARTGNCFGGYGANSWRPGSNKVDRHAFTFTFDQLGQGRMAMAQATLNYSSQQLVFSNDLYFTNSVMTHATGAAAGADVYSPADVHEVEVWGAQ
jgi:hypothetical protein